MTGEKGGYFRRGPDVTGDDIYSYHVHFPEPSICQRCQAILKKGKWSLDEALRAEVLKWENPKQVLCPACRRIMDDYPAGILTLKGAYLEGHKEDILQTIHNEEQNSKQKNPLERIMKIEEAQRRHHHHDYRFQVGPENGPGRKPGKRRRAEGQFFPRE